MLLLLVMARTLRGSGAGVRRAVGCESTDETEHMREIVRSGHRDSARGSAIGSVRADPIGTTASSQRVAAAQPPAFHAP